MLYSIFFLIKIILKITIILTWCNILKSSFFIEFLCIKFGSGKAWVKRMIPWAWFFSKRRRIKENVSIFTAVKAGNAALGIIIDP